MKLKILCIFLLLWLIVFSPIFADAYSFILTQQIDEIYGVHFIKENGDVESRIAMRFYLSANFSPPKMNIAFNPMEHRTNDPVENISILVCEPKHWSNNQIKGYYGECNKEYASKFFNNSDKKRRMYPISFFVDKKDKKQEFVYLINYTMPNFTFEQGDYQVAWLNCGNLRTHSVINSIVLPTEEDIPRFIPDAKLSRYSYYDNGKERFRWVFTFENEKEIILWYYNDKKVKNKKNFRESIRTEGFG
ncbi:MAG: hypothetical protein DRN66_03775 [Candidatus Nanohalarchaeota archaeon]|nr:MAG: hypothetical protein DRN66_03775 [Candidatus Nanohaloarchaeota archaeon]